MDARQERGLAIASKCKLTQQGCVWRVPSQSGKGDYIVFPSETEPHCTCPDHTEWNHRCKHIWAVIYRAEHQVNADGSTTITETLTVAQRVTYSQDWANYDEAQTNEKHRFQELLHDLCRLIPVEQQEKRGRGRPKIPISDATFAACFKVYSTLSTRRFMCDLKDACKMGYLSREVHFTSVAGFLEDSALTPVLHRLIKQSSLPLRSV